jgi:hypothetical protein
VGTRLQSHSGQRRNRSFVRLEYQMHNFILYSWLLLYFISHLEVIWSLNLIWIQLSLWFMKRFENWKGFHILLIRLGQNRPSPQSHPKPARPCHPPHMAQVPSELAHGNVAVRPPYSLSWYPFQILFAISMITTWFELGINQSLPRLRIRRNPQ